MITNVTGILVGQYTDRKALTGCTVVLCPPKTIASCEVRGSSPGSRELALLAPEKQMQEIHAIFLTGGSAFGLGAANGVMKYLAENKMGYRLRIPKPTTRFMLFFQSDQSSINTKTKIAGKSFNWTDIENIK